MSWRQYELTDKELLIIEPLLPNKPRGMPRGRSAGAEWYSLAVPIWLTMGGDPEHYGPPTTFYNRLIRWRKAGVWDQLLAAVSAGFNGELVMIDSKATALPQSHLE